MPDICIVTDRHLSTNPRVWKEAQVLSRNGYNVTIITQFNSKEFITRDRLLLQQLGLSVKYYAAVDVSAGNARISSVYYKIRTRLAYLLKKAGMDSVYLLSYAPEKIYHAALRENADLYIAHVECGLYAGMRLVKQGKRVAFDFEDWYSEDYLVPTRPVRLLKMLESYALNHGTFVTCPSASMADALKMHSNKSVTIQAVYNSFPDEMKMPESEKQSNIVSLLWFSQTVGPGRGLEKLILSLNSVHSKVKLTLVGNCSDTYRHSIRNIFPFKLGHQLQFVPLVKHHELYQIMYNHDIGLALENDTPENRDKTITNKILQYLQAGIKVLATGTSGQNEVAGHFHDAVKIVDPNDNADWGAALQQLIDTQIDKQEVIERYNRLFGWATQEQKILKLVADALAK